MKIEYTQVFGFESALRGMRNPMDSWGKSDSCFLKDYKQFTHNYTENIEQFVLGQDDKALSQKLTKAGSEHCKHLRQIQVWIDLTLPRFIHSELDTYHYNTKVSSSTMHTIHKRKLTQDDFEYEIHQGTLSRLNHLIELRMNDQLCSDEFIHTIKNELPEGFLQKRTINTNYAELLNIYWQRRNHRLSQWHTICDWIEQLPYLKELTGINS
jgi:hypothetical protein